MNRKRMNSLLVLLVLLFLEALLIDTTHAVVRFRLSWAWSNAIEAPMRARTDRMKESIMPELRQVQLIIAAGKSIMPELGQAQPTTAAGKKSIMPELSLVRLGNAPVHYTEAKLLSYRIPTSLKETPGPVPPNTATNLNNLAELELAQGRYEATKLLLQRASVIWKQVLGSAYPDTAENLNNLAWLELAQGRYEAAELLFQRAFQRAIQK